jgi:hypothetical protein
MALELPDELPWPTNASAAVFSDIYDWDLVVAIPDRHNILDRRVVLCVGPFPCALTVTGRGKGVLARVENGALACKETDGCTSVKLDSLLVLCDGYFATGSVLEVGGSLLSVSGAHFRGCTCRIDGCVVHAYGRGAAVTAKSTRFEHTHSSGSGGAISVVGGVLGVSFSAFVNCSAVGSGGAVSGTQFYCYGSSEMFETVIEISESSFVQCTSACDGGGLAVSSEAVRLNVSASKFAGCRSVGAGGAVSISSMALGSVSDSLFLSNWAEGVGGGALHADNAVLVVSNISCRGNMALSGGGAVLFWNGNILPVINGPRGQAAGQRGQDTEDKLLVFPGDPIMMCHPSNNALYGPCAASTFKALQVPAVPRLRQFVKLDTSKCVYCWGVLNS